jgi:Fic family protein
MLREVVVSIPPLIASRGVALDSALAAEVEAAVHEIAALDAAHGVDLEAIAILLLRTESVASSKIESVEADLDDYARALHGNRSNPSAVSMVAATTALEQFIGDVDRTGRIRLSAVVSAHRALMDDAATEAEYAGRLRDMQNWIGGSDHSPRDALYVPPPPEDVERYLDDLVVFTNRHDLPALVQAAIAHAQFESIHPFTDGNGRIGRALINAILRCRGVTSRVVVPLASALVAHRERCFSVLGAYRQGEAGPLISSCAAGSRLAATEAQRTAARFREIPVQWEELVGGVRSGSATRKLLELLPTRPILSSEDACAFVGGSRSSVFAALLRLAEAGVLRPLTERKRDQIWGAGLVLDELEDLGARIARAAA